MKWLFPRQVKWVHGTLTGTAEEAPLVLDDTDDTHALFLTSPYTAPQAPNTTLLFTSHVPTELSLSLCALKPYTLPGHNVTTTATTRGPSVAPRQQLWVSNLTASTGYTVYLVQTEAQSMSLGSPLAFQTKPADTGCQLIHDLAFCDQVAYSVPVGLGTQASLSNITSSYDAQAKALFQPFGTAISQFNCDTTQYSLVRGCDDCSADYKRWLCAVTIPRCTSSNAMVPGTQVLGQTPAVAVRPIAANQSRNPWVDQTYAPSDWVELLPCIDLCYRTVQSCPPFLNFYCPTGDLATLQYGYWQTGVLSANNTEFVYNANNPSCNRVGLSPSLLVISSDGRHRSCLSPQTSSTTIDIVHLLL
ncbi:stretch-activated Ca2+-permeable channel component-domain-containing protein [Spinellus fusiger]|nr:stretch-activated Ca2+-permeable channel component-domain-containing protein [Spinellus fusiger]